MNLDTKYAYGDGARNRLSAIPRDQLTSFLDQIARQSLKAVLRRLPELHGFRPDSDAGVEEQKKRLVRRITDDGGHGASKRDWFVLRQLWWQWAQMRLEGSPILASVQAYMKSPDDAAALEELLLICINDAERQSVSREAFTDFFRFGPVDENNDVLDILKSASPEGDLKDKQYLANLRPTMKALESQLTTLRETVAALSERLDSLTDVQRGTADKVADANALGSVLVKQIEDADNESSRRATEMGSIRVDLGALLAALDGEDGLQQRFVLQSEAIRRLEGSAEASQFNLQRAIDDQSATLNGLSQMIQLTESRLRDEMEELKAISRASGAKANVVGTQDGTFVGRPRVLKYAPNLNVIPRGSDLRTAADLLESIKTNLLDVGLAQDNVPSVAASALAALCSGQILSARGAFSPLILTAIVPLLAPEATAVEVPFGCHDDRELGLLLAEERNPFSCLVFSGANRGAFELYANALIEDAVLRQTNLPAKWNTVTLTTLLDGISSIPISPAMAATGPIFDTECMTWRRNKKNVPAIHGSRLKVPPWSLQAWEPAVPDFVSAALSLIGNQMASYRGVAGHSIRNVGNIFQALINEALLTSADAESALVAYWCIPYLLTCGVTPQQIRKNVGASELADSIKNSVVASLLIPRGV